MRKITKRRLSNPQKRKALEELRLLVAKPATSVRSIERRMVKIYQQYGHRDMEYYAAECINDLKLERWCLLRDSFEWTEENIARLEEANERLKQALIDMRRQTIEVYEKIGNWRTPDKDLRVSGTLWVEDMTFDGWEKDEDMKWNLFDVMTSKSGSNFYTNSVSMEFWLDYNKMASDTAETCQSEMEVLYLEDKLDNWNELMPRDKTENLHLVYAVHNLYEHCNWSLQDIMNIKSYKTEIMIEYSPRNESNME